jgi:hypothetical protein
VAAIPFLAAAVGMWVNGLVVDALARRGYDLAKTRKTAIVIGLVLSALGTCWWCNPPRRPGGGFYLHGAVLRPFCRDVGLGAGAGIGGGA